MRAPNFVLKTSFTSQAAPKSADGLEASPDTPTNTKSTSHPWMAPPYSERTYVTMPSLLAGRVRRDHEDRSDRTSSPSLVE